MNSKSQLSLVKSLIKEGWLKSPSVIKAFKKIDRKDFVIENFKHLAYENSALPIGFGQTISQPLVVAFMIELLEPKKGDKILDIGSGSGWTTALLSYLVGSKGKVVALEIIPELKVFGQENVRKYNFIKKGIATFILGDGSKGYPPLAPFDKILCSASVQKEDIPEAWKSQLKEKGIIVSSIKDEIWKIQKIKKDEFKIERYPGFVFVPLVEK